MGASSDGTPEAPPRRGPHQEDKGSARVLGRYVLHGELAAGGMATVHLGRFKGEAGFTRTVAIKRLHAQFAKDPDFVAMFVDEARLAARIRHPNVVPTLDVIRDGASEAAGDAEIFLVMEYVAGESLSRLLRALQAKKRLVPPRIATTLLSGVLHGLHAAHEATSEKGSPLGIVHRDVSPQNVLVGIDGIAHVLDFGVAKAAGRLHTTRDGELKGKLAYMAPEQLETGTLTRQSDVYAAAVVLWETLTLRRLFEGDSEGALLMQVLGGKIAAPSTLVPGLSRELDEIVLRGLARDPAKRWPTARDFAIALEKCGPFAPPSEIGEWVQSIAGDVLARRAKLVAEIEGGSMRLPAAPPASEAPRSAGDVLSQVSAIALSSSDPAEPLTPQSRWGRGYFLAGGIAGLLLVLLFFALKHGAIPGHPSAESGAAPPPEVMALAPQSAVPVIPSAAPAAPATGTAQEDPAGAPAATAVVEARPAAVHEPPATPGWAPAQKHASPSPSSPPPPKPAAKARADCDPPFTRDAVGHKHYKLQCL